MLKFLFVCLLWTAPAAAETIAIIGDSVSTGGASHSALAFDIDRMEAVFGGKTKLDIDEATLSFLTSEGVTNPTIPPERLGLSPREFVHPLVWMLNSFVTSMSSQYLDMEEFSWGNLLGHLGAADKILIAARDGEKSLHAKQQVDRILDGAPGQALDHVFIFFTGNDLCASQAELITARDDYTDEISKAVRYLITNATPAAAGKITHIWLMDPLGVAQLVTSPAIQNKKIWAYGAEHTCKQLQSNDLDKNLIGTPTNAVTPVARAILGQIFSGGTAGLCPTLFSYHHTNEITDLLPISDALNGYRAGLAEIAKNLNELNPRYRVAVLNSPSTLSFADTDIGNDCFHLSVRGQMKIAKLVKTEIESKVKVSK
ncbi:MAG: hypothetical protein H7249_14045 [Chitinophagaceae bacterium]|nr:hypothetical protein [Oligoflexus sp.]